MPARMPVAGSSPAFTDVFSLWKSTHMRQSNQSQLTVNSCAFVADFGGMMTGRTLLRCRGQASGVLTINI